MIRRTDTSLGILVPIFASFSGALRRVRQTREAPAHEMREAACTLAGLLRNLAFADLLGHWDDYRQVVVRVWPSPQYVQLVRAGCLVVDEPDWTPRDEAAVNGCDWMS